MTATESIREQFRTQHGVRLVTEAEEGGGLSRLPAGVYGFTYAPLSESPLFRRNSYHSFEVHKGADGQWRLVAFVAPADAEAIRTGQREVRARLYPDSWNAATDLVVISSSRLRAKKLLPSREPGNWVAVTVYPQPD
jgi:hypothetical protein